MSLHPNDVVFSRMAFSLAQNAADVSVLHPPQEFGNDLMVTPGAGVGAHGQRHNVHVLVFATNNAASALSAGAGATVGLNSTATSTGRVAVVAAPVYDTNQGDAASGSSALTGSGVNGSIAFQTMWTNIDHTDPFGANGVVQKVGTGTTPSADAMVLLERCRVLRVWYCLNNDIAMTVAPSPDLTATTKGDPDAEATVGGVTTTGTDYGYRMEDLGTYDVGETVLAQTATVAASAVWSVVTIPLKLREVADMAPQIVFYDNNSAASGSVTFTTSGGVYGSAGRYRTGDDAFAIAQSNSGEPANSAGGYTKLNTGGGSNTSVWHLRLTSAALPTSTFGGGGSSNGVGIFVVRGLDPNTPYTFTDDNETEATMDVPAGTIVRSRDIDISIFQQGLSGVTSNFAFTPSPASTTVCFASSANSNNRSRGQAYAVFGSLTPGATAGITAVSNWPSVVYRGGHLVLHQAPRIWEMEGEFGGAMLEYGAEIDVTSAGPFIETTFIGSMGAFEATFRASRPVYVSPRPIVWIRGFDGARKIALD